MGLLQEYQAKILEVGRALGYECRKSFKKSAMGDAVWLDRASRRYASSLLPTVAFKLLTFETAKEIQEAIMTLQIISPALGVLAILEDAYAIRADRLKRYTAETYPEHIRRVAEKTAGAIKLTFRTEVWGQKDIDRLYREEVEGRLRFP